MHEQTCVSGTASYWDTLKKEIQEAAPSLGIDSIGFASADPFLSLKSILEEHRAKGYESGFEEPDIEKRIHPALDGAKPASLIAIAVAYPSKMKNPPKSEPGRYRGILARSAWGRDYHLVLREAMERLEAFIRERVPEAIIKNMVDTGELVDRAVSERAGIGFSGKNCAIISPELGSWIYLGELVTNIPFQPDEPVTDGCGECTKCIDACPTGALVGPGQLNAQRCISFLTQTKGFLDEEFMLKIGNRLYGCDTCQIVCPKNRGLNWELHPELTPDPEIVKPLLLPLLDMSNREFKERFGSSAAAWRGKKPIQRNAVIALGNFKDVTAVPKLAEVLLEDPRPELRGTAAWALSRIGGEDAMKAINEASEKEQHEKVKEMIGQAASALLANVKEDKNEQQALSGPRELQGTVFPHEVRPGQKTIYYDELDSPIGVLTVCSTEQGICLIEFGAFEVKQAVLQQWARTWVGEYGFARDPERLAEAIGQLREYFAGTRTSFDLQLDLRGTPFQLQVWGALADIPYGDVVSYQTIAEAIGRPMAVRAVGGANNKNPLPIVIPCHRVSGKDGSLVGYAGGLQAKAHLLSIERKTP
ncbi:tRNA epoxyqueuosine(34) reductase QueG [Paenibacillus terreus]|uniref:Methylated-DNA--protein-cysteine methyltransferase n=1 Tax=Paenibacillus terreus TaxID=1387834 RepID=A0ABV5BBC5_9BACL